MEEREREDWKLKSERMNRASLRTVKFKLESGVYDYEHLENEKQLLRGDNTLIKPHLAIHTFIFP